MLYACQCHDVNRFVAGAMRRVLTFLSSNVMAAADACEIELNLRLQDSAASAAREIADLQLGTLLSCFPHQVI
jgi:hypothetical protein